MESIPTPSAPPDPDIQDTQETLLHSLDVLLERYLHLLDSYQKSRLKLTEQLSAGYFSLAQANFKSPNRVSYGQDFYDQRMQASTKIDIRKGQTATAPRVALIAACAPSATKSPGSQPLTKSLDIVDEFEKGPSVQKEVAEKPSRNPLSWFGILIPLALRTAQASFKSALNEAVPDLINISAEMRDLEAETEELRHRIRNME
ncbi:hypothetical protein MMC11_003299 [Xylographa trunciseda]|nr:hypothetical protein [Xylographa trunciseda]